MPLKINTAHPEFKRIKSELDWRELLAAHQAGGDKAFDQKWIELYGEDPPDNKPTDRPPLKAA